MRLQRLRGQASCGNMRRMPAAAHPTALRALLATALAASAPALALAQSACSSDGQPQPTALYERFLNADCEACWASAPAHMPGPSALVVDWIVPGRLGDDAPLSAAATRDALERLQQLQRPVPAQTDTHISTVAPAGSAPGRLRVSTGPAINDYIGTGIRLMPAATASRTSGPVAFTLLLVETVPAGAEGSPVERNLVRNALQGNWILRKQLSKAEWSRWMENRPMRIPDGARPERLRVLGWLQGADGQLLAAAQSRCAASE